jgi:arginyl-tRNA synthetase
LMQEMTETAQKNCGRFREVRYLFRWRKAELYNTIGLGALKYYILK